MKRRSLAPRLAVPLIVATVAIATLVAQPAHAEDRTSSPDAIAELVQTAAQEAGVSQTSDDPTLTSDAVVNLPKDPTVGVFVEQQGESALQVPLPQGVTLAEGVNTSHDVMVFAGTGDSPDVTVEALPTGARVTTVIDQNTRDRSFDYPLPDGVTAELMSDGRIELMERADVGLSEGQTEIVRIVGYIEPAWAVDAAGKSVSTSYEIEQDVITQHVATDDATTYPVVADPQWSVTSWNQVRIRWNRAETATIAGGGWAATGAAGACGAAGGSLAGPPGAAVGTAACLAAAGSAVYTAGVAQNSRPKQCLEMYATIVFAIQPFFLPWFGTYSGGSCR